MVARLGVLLCALAMAASGAWAQFSGNISGTVQDPTDANVADATVTVTNVSTGGTLTAKSDSAGSFRFLSLAPGDYKISVSATGFAITNVTVTLLTEQTL